ncbi:hypothetical protein ILUMI_05769 [Ignelater luminosus]|uniref:Uncharacterized protein n=1 Tax=Ignelater luminosus TaxID=2038154 RepID=A0A8K0GG22_IGNLU|nr:hypothetical protein ILUMI_05769 [Ignelater luminosus]
MEKTHTTGTQQTKGYIRRRNRAKEVGKEAKQKRPIEFGLKGNKRKEIRVVMDENNQIKVSEEDTMKVWETFYSKKFEQKANMGDPGVEQEINNEQQSKEKEQLEGITREEIEEAVGKIKIGKASGEDNMEPELIKKMGKEGIKF